jgi:hypothetical protein
MFGFQKPPHLFDLDSRDLQKPDVLFEHFPEHINRSIDHLFISLAKDSGSRESRKVINLAGAREAVRLELFELFHPRSDAALTYTEYVSGMEKMSSSFAIR